MEEGTDDSYFVFNTPNRISTECVVKFPFFIENYFKTQVRKKRVPCYIDNKYQSDFFDHHLKVVKVERRTLRL